MGGLILLLVLCVIMAVASFLAGALPLSMSLSQPQLRLLSSIGVGILVGTSLIVIIPEGIEAISSHDRSGHSHGARSLQIVPSISRSLSRDAVEGRDGARFATAQGAPLHEPIALRASYLDADQLPGYVARRADAEKEKEKDASAQPTAGKEKEDRREAGGIPTFYVGLSLIMGFVLMFLIDRLPRHASESLQAPPPPREISLDNLGAESSQTDEESASFLGSLAPTPKQSRSLATTTGLVIHATADGIAMGASSSTSNTKLGFIIFFAILIHKAPAAFGLTSVLLKQGLSKRAARGHLAVFSLAAPAGAIGTWLLITLLGGGSFEGEGSNWWTGMLLLFSGGTFLYVAMHAMQDDNLPQALDHPSLNGFGEGGGTNQRKQNRPQMRDTVATAVGMLLPLLAQFGHVH